jgi:hypothetical protein
VRPFRNGCRRAGAGSPAEPTGGRVVGVHPDDVAVRHAIRPAVRRRSPTRRSDRILVDRPVLVRPDRVSQSDAGRLALADLSKTRVSERQMGAGLAPAAHSEAPEGTGGRTGQSVRTGSEQVRSRYDPPRAPRSVALRPSNPAPGTVPRIAPRCGLAVRTCPFGQDEMYRPRSSGHNRLIHELRWNHSRLIPDFPPDVDGMWTRHVATSAQPQSNVDSRDGGG